MRKGKNSAKEQNNIYLLPRMLGHYKLQSVEVHKAWVKSPEVLKNCLTGLHFASEHVENFEINHISHPLRQSEPALVLGDREVLIKKVARLQVQADHELATLSRSQQRTVCWLGSYPDSISSIVMADCTPY